MQQPIGVAVAPDVLAAQAREPGPHRFGREVDQRHLAQRGRDVVVEQRLIPNPGARLDVALIDPGLAVLGQPNMPYCNVFRAFLGRCPLVALDHAALPEQPPLGVHPCGERRRPVVADQVGADVAGLEAARPFADRPPASVVRSSGHVVSPRVSR